MDSRDTAIAAAGAAMTDWPDRVVRALHPIDAPPAWPGWNHDFIVDLIGNRPRVGAAVLLAIRDGPDPRMVFTLRSNEVARHAGQVSFPGGAAESADVNVVATALRESHEEVALDPSAAVPLGYLDCLETVSGFCVTPVVARLAHDAVLTPQSAEVAQLFEVPVAFLIDPGNIRQVEYHSPWGSRRVYEYAGVKPRIWGATALMLVNLVRRMGMQV